ncbi:MAG TPA: hypothetical protein DDZ66_04345 [Firmicutes bacterium]|jgi:nitrogen fixation protein NifB|nr:hypothetical protein [Bacillota bacterium]
MIKHPCYTGGQGHNIARIHLPIAKKCNLGCAFCELRDNAQPETLSTEEAIAALEYHKEHLENLKIVGIAGPGEPLVNSSTFQILEYVQRNHPDLSTCLCTNGVEVLNKLADIERVCDYFTVTVNALSVEVAKELYCYVKVDGSVSREDNAYSKYLDLVWSGIEELGKLKSLKGFKINTILVPGVNDHEIESIAKKAAKLGVMELNIKSFMPRGLLKDQKAPTRLQMQHAIARAEKWIPVFKHCKNCRPDACGVPGRDLYLLTGQCG